MIMNTAASKSRITDKSGAVIVFDGERAWVSPQDSTFKKPRFEALTWPYFVAAQFKFDDPGVHVEPQGVKKLQGKMYQTAKVTFDAGVGDSPDDWYVLYQDLETKTLKAMSYIVTYGKGEKSKVSEPHAIVYDDFETVDGVTLATDWKFYKWSEEKGVYGEPIGTATLSGFEFVEPTTNVFSKPNGAIEDKLPTQ